MTIRFQLIPEAVTWIGSAFENKTAVSPLATLNVPGFSEGDKKELQEQEIIDTAGALTPKAYEFFNSLAEVDKFAGFRVSGAFGKIDKVAYFRKNKVFWVDNAGGSYIFSDSQDTITMLTILNEITGISHLVNSALDVELDPTAALVFASLLDLTRQAALIGCAEKGSIPEGFAIGDIQEGCKMTGGRWVGSYLRNLRLSGASLNEMNIETALAAMIETGIVAKTESGYTLIHEAYALAVNLLVIENAFHLRVGKLEGEIQSGEAVVLQAGLHDILMIDSDGGKIGFTSISTNALHEYLIQMVTEAPKF